METQRFEQIKAEITKATASQVLGLERLIGQIISEQIAELRLARRTNLTLDLRQCPYCSTKGATLHGKDKRGRQRFRCCNDRCRRTYNILTGTAMARARKPERGGRANSDRSISGKSA